MARRLVWLPDKRYYGSAVVWRSVQCGSQRPSERLLYRWLWEYFPGCVSLWEPSGDAVHRRLVRSVLRCRWLRNRFHGVTRSTPCRFKWMPLDAGPAEYVHRGVWRWYVVYPTAVNQSPYTSSCSRVRTWIWRV